MCVRKFRSNPATLQSGETTNKSILSFGSHMLRKQRMFLLKPVLADGLLNALFVSSVV